MEVGRDGKRILLESVTTFELLHVYKIMPPDLYEGSSDASSETMDI
jgi:hypothetical protein